TPGMHAVWRIPIWVVLLLLAFARPARASNHNEITVTNRIHIPTTRKFNPKFWLGNLDDPVPPADYLPNDKHRVRKWYWRNPAHNLFFYVIGIADKTFRRSGRCPADVFNPHQGWNWTVCKYKWVRLPFISYRREPFKFYIGWRERGNFGMELKWRQEKSS